MRCKNCDNLVWFGDYSLYYCDITKKEVKAKDKCHVANKEDKIREKDSKHIRE